MDKKLRGNGRLQIAAMSVTTACESSHSNLNVGTAVQGGKIESNVHRTGAYSYDSLLNSRCSSRLDFYHKFPITFLHMSNLGPFASGPLVTRRLGFFLFHSQSS